MGCSSETAAASCGLTPARPPAGYFFPESPVTSSPRVTCSAAAASPRFEDGAKSAESCFRGSYVATLTIANYRSWISQSLPHPHPAPEPRARGGETRCAESHTQTHLRCLRRTRVQTGGGKPRQTPSAEQLPVPAGKGPSCWGLASRLAAPRNTRDFLPRPLLPRSQPSGPCSRDPSVRTCGGRGLALTLLAGIRIHAAGCWRGVHSLPPVCRALGAGVPARAVRRSRCGQPGGGSPGGAVWAVRGGRGQEAAPQRRAPPAPHSRRPRAGACARGARGARGGGWGAPGASGEGRGEARVAPSRSRRRLAGSRRGLNTPGAVPLLPPAPGARSPDSGSAAKWRGGRG